MSEFQSKVVDRKMEDGEIFFSYFLSGICHNNIMNFFFETDKIFHYLDFFSFLRKMSGP